MYILFCILFKDEYNINKIMEYCVYIYIYMRGNLVCNWWDEIVNYVMIVEILYFKDYCMDILCIIKGFYL